MYARAICSTNPRATLPEGARVREENGAHPALERLFPIVYHILRDQRNTLWREANATNEPAVLFHAVKEPG